MLAIRSARPGDEAGIAEVHVASWKTTYAGLIPDSVLQALSVEKRARTWADAVRRTHESQSKEAIFVYEDSAGKIHGFIAGGAERERDCGFDGELYALYLYQDQQRQGLGRRLTHQLASWLIKNGCKRMRLWVLDSNPSRRFYEKLGGKLLPASKTVDFDGKACLEVAYGWDDLQALAVSTSDTPSKN